MMLKENKVIFGSMLALVGQTLEGGHLMGSNLTASDRIPPRLPPRLLPRIFWLNSHLIIELASKLATNVLFMILDA